MEHGIIPEHSGWHRRSPQTSMVSGTRSSNELADDKPASPTAPEHRPSRKAVRGSRRTRIPSRHRLEVRDLQVSALEFRGR
jgi:hypothetical protein